MNPTDDRLVRLFVALLLEASVIEELQVLQRLLRQHLPEGLRWTRADQLHLTLHFLGEVAAEEVAETCAWLRQAKAGHAEFRLRLGAVGRFPERGRPRVLWVGLEGEIERLIRLQNDVARVMERFGARRQGDRFQPHLTVARIRPDVSVPGNFGDLLGECPAPRPLSWVVRHVHLMRSELLPTGARYTVLDSVPLV